ERGREAVRVAVYGGQQPYAGDKRDAAIEWLRTKEIADEKRAPKTYHYLKWTLDAAIAAAVLALIGVLRATGVIPHWMQVLQCAVAANSVISAWSKSITTVNVLSAALNAIAGVGAGASGRLNCPKMT